MNKKYFLFVVLIVLTVCFLIYDSLRFFDNKLHVVFCNVGQGDSAFFRTNKGIDILIDGGPDDKVIACIQKHMPIWDRTIDFVFLTHPDADHLIGLIPVFSSYKVKNFITQNVTDNNSAVHQELLIIVKKKRITPRFVFSGQTYSLGEDMSTFILWPNKKIGGTVAKSSVNNGSIVQKISFGNFDLLMTGDIDAKIFDYLEKDRDIDVLKVPHHGSKNGMDEKLFTIINPLFAIISVGKNSYGHPSDQVISLFRQYTTKVFRTDKQGSIEFVTDGKNMKVYKEKN